MRVQEISDRVRLAPLTRDQRADALSSRLRVVMASKARLL